MIDYVQQYLFDSDDFADAIDCGQEASKVPNLTLLAARDYQIAWRDGIRSTWLRTDTPAIGIAATGTGKSMGAGLVFRDIVDGLLGGFGRDPRAIFIAHRSLLVEQAYHALTYLLPDKIVEMEMGESRARGNADIVVACIDSLAIPRRLKYFPPGRYAGVVWDECHRYGRNNLKVKRLLNHFGSPTRHLGITATPDRTDRNMPFTEIAFNYDVWQAVQDGWLVPPHMSYEFSADVKLERVKMKDGDFDADDLADLMQQSGPLAAVVEAARKWSNFSNGRPAKRSTVITCSSVRHAQRVAKILNEWHDKEGSGRAVSVYSGDQDGRRDAIAGFRSGEYQYITHFDILTEGFDSDRPKVLINGRPTKSRWVFGQGAGRLLRPAGSCRDALARAPDAASRRAIIAASEKPGAMIVDVAGTTHGLSVDLLSIFRAPDDDDDLIKRVRAKAQRRGETGLGTNVLEELAIIRAEERKKRQEAEDKRWSGVLVGSTLQTTHVDAFSPPVVVGREPVWVKGKKPTLSMKKSLLRAGFARKDVERYSYAMAKKMLDLAIKRAKQGLCTYKQLRILNENGIDGNFLTFDEASAEISKLFGRRGRHGVVS